MSVHVLKRTTAPAAAPTQVGQHWIDTVTGKHYLAKGTASVADWVEFVADTGITQLTGDVTAGPGSGSQAATLANSGVSAGSYTNASVTVDAKGRVTSASNGQVYSTAVFGKYKISTNTTPPPASGYIKYNNATQISSTSLYIYDVTQDGVDINLLLSKIVVGTILTVQDRDDHTNYQRWVVSSAVTDNTTYWTVPVTLDSSNGTGTSNFANNHEIVLAGFNGGVVSSVTASSPLSSSGGANPNITIQTANGSQAGALSSTDWTTFNNKQAALGFTPENVANKSTNTSLGSSDTLYPSQKAVKDYVDAQNTPTTSAIGASDIDWSIVKLKGGLYTKALSANETFTFSNLTSGQTIIVRLTNDANNWTVTWPTVKWAGGIPPTMTSGAKSDIYTFVYDGTDVFGSFVQDMF